MKAKELRQDLIRCIGVPIEENWTDAGTVKTNYLTAGQGTPVILVHGHSVTGAVSWGSVISVLSSHFKVIAPDVVGYGESEKPSASYSRSFFAEWLGNFLDALKIMNATLVGISQGGAISIQYALDNPDRVDRLVLINSAGLGKWIPPVGYAVSMAFRYIYPSYLAGRWNSRYLVRNPKNIDKTLIDYGITLSKRCDSGRAIFQGKGKSAIPFSDYHLSRISQPTLFLCGEDDRVMPHYLSKRAQKKIPNAQIKIIPDAGHSLFFDQPEMFRDEVIAFLNENSTAAIPAHKGC